MKIYTKNGDQGYTQLADGTGLHKAESRIQAIGEIDELNCHLGLIASNLPKNIEKSIAEIQKSLFALGAHISSNSPELLGNMKLVSLHDIVFLEEEIDSIESQLNPLKNFILPGGNELIAQTQITRAVCRRAERTLIHWVITEEKEDYQTAIAYLNRLSDYLFIVCRYLHKELNVPEIPWKSGK